MPLDGRRVLVTGAASGIGRAIAELFLAEGAGVALLDNRAEALATAGKELAKGGWSDRVTTVAADVTDAGQIDDAVARAVTALGGLDGIVNSAGVDLLKPFTAMTVADWNRVLAVNLTGPMNVCRAAVPALQAAGGGTIVNIASGAGLRPLADRTAYCASKAGLVMFSKALAIDLAGDNIRVNAICPGAIDTPMLELSYRDAPDPEAERERIRGRYALHRFGQPADIAAAARYLTGDDSGFVTGTALAVDGGRSFH